MASRSVRLSDINTMVNTVVTIVAIYLGLKALGGISAVGGEFGKSAGQWWFNLTSGPSVKPLGVVQLPGGESTTVAAIVDAGGKIDGKGFFTWRGATYQITGRNTAGDYTAVRIIG